MKFFKKNKKQPKENMVFLESVYNKIVNTIGSLPAESGGLLLGNEDDYIIQEVVFDEEAKTSRVTYEFNVDYLNKIVKHFWKHKGLSVIGFIHSHPTSLSRPSSPDIDYFTSCFESIPREKYHVPIVFTIPDGGFKIHPHVIYDNDMRSTKKAILQVIQDDQYQIVRKEILKKKKVSSKNANVNELNDFSRIEKAVDIDLVKNAHVVVVGAGGAYSLYESLARCGVGEITAIDFDIVEETNLVRQGYDLDNIGTPKVEALKERLLQVNAGTQVNIIQKDFTEMKEPEIEEVFGQADIFLFLTDSFEAQALGNKMALEFNKPAIWAGYYELSRCAEIVFYIPEVTPACFRCVVSDRYKAQEESKKSGENPNPTSQCNTIFHSQLLDAQIGMLAMAILHNDTEGYEFSNWFGSHWERSLLQFKINPFFESNLFDSLKEESKGKAHIFNSIWQEVKQERTENDFEDCPDCIGLRDSKKLIKSDA